MTVYTCSFQHNGRQHVVHIHADDPLDASRRLRAIGMTARVDGELVAEIPVKVPLPWPGWWRRVMGWRS